MLEVAAPSLADPVTAQAVSQLAQSGLPLVLSDYKAGTEIPAGLAFRFVMADARVQPVTIRVPGILIATGIDEPAAFDAAIKAGYGGAAGWFFKAGQTTAKKLAPAHEIEQIGHPHNDRYGEHGNWPAQAFRQQQEGERCRHQPVYRETQEGGQVAEIVEQRNADQHSKCGKQDPALGQFAQQQRAQYAGHHGQTAAARHRSGVQGALVGQIDGHGLCAIRT